MKLFLQKSPTIWQSEYCVPFKRKSFFTW